VILQDNDMHIKDLFSPLSRPAIILIGLLLILGLLSQTELVTAQRPAPPGPPQAAAVPPGSPGLAQNLNNLQWNHSCMMCHQSEKLQGLTRDSVVLSLKIEEQVLARSVHGSAGLQCTSCHSSLDGYPHQGKEQVACMDCHSQVLFTVTAPLPYENDRQMTTELNQTCLACHADQAAGKTMHTQVSKRGGSSGPLCVDCHGGHDVQRTGQSADRTNNMCSSCHTLTVRALQENRHGGEAPPNVERSCTQCHPAHQTGTPAGATPGASDSTGSVPVNPHYISEWNKNCVMCHEYSQLSGFTRDNQLIPLTVDELTYSQSVHGKASLGCSACHSPYNGYPHQETGLVSCSSCHGSKEGEREVKGALPYDDPRSLSIHWNQSCATCHPTVFESSTDSMHMKVFTAGNRMAPLCSDCHGSHDITSLRSVSEKVTETCISCHASVYTSFNVSVHGGNLPDQELKPLNCGDCHGVHEIRGPRSPNFRNEIVDTCNACHIDPEKLAGFGFFSNQYSPHMDRFHGSSAALVREAGSGLVRTGVGCYDCHGAHNVRQADDPLSPVHPNNLLDTCQKCHPGADRSFLRLWAGQVWPVQQDRHLEGQVSNLSKVLFPSLVGLMGAYIGLDARKRHAERKALMKQILEDK
jgi:hypothetical protein